MNEQDATRRLKLPSIDIVHRLATASVVSGVSRCAMRDMIDAAADEIERLRAERDEARREVCHLRPSVCLGAQTADAYADQRGWDCFKEVR